MKKNLPFVSFLLLFFIANLSVSAQCTYLSAVSDITLNCTSFGSNKTGVAYNPNQNLYYSVTSGSSSYILETFSSAGGNTISTASQGGDYRGYWWNPSLNRPEGNTLNGGGIYSNLLNGSGYPTGVVNSEGTGGQPINQSCGALNLASTNQILYYNSGALYRYNRLTGALISSVTITGLPAGSNLNIYGIIYTGVAGSEVGVYDYTNRRVLFINYVTGTYTNYCQLPGSAPNPSMYMFAYANNRVFLYDGVSKWTGYPITGSSCPGEALQFNGGYIERSAFTLGSSWTAEGWIKPTGVSSTFWKAVIAQDYWQAPGGQGFAIRIVSDSVGVECPTGGGASTFIQARVTANVWTHIAATYGNGVLTFYKDGIFIGAKTMTNNACTLPFHIGARNGNGGTGVIDAYSGVMDEVRVWNTTRSQCEIQTYMNAEIENNATGLLGNYHFNQGLAGGTNTGITTLDDATTGANDCTLTSFTLTGTTGNFISPGAVISNNSNANPAPTGSITVKGNGNTITNNLAVTSTTNNTDFSSAVTRSFVITNSGAGAMKIGNPYMTGADAADFTITTSPATTLASTASTTFIVTFNPSSSGAKTASVNINTNDCSKPVFKFLVQAAAVQAETFNFDGVNDAIAIPNISINNQSFTIEFWAKRNATNPANCYAVSQGTSNNYVALQIGFPGTNTLKFGFWNDDLDITNAACSDGQYHHWACVYKSGTTEGFNRFVYLDGELLYAQRSYTAYQGTGTFYIGRNISAGGYYNGLLDEVRVWGTARSQCEIQSYKNCEITGAATGLIANYHFNQGVAFGANSTQTLVTDATGGAHTGTLTGATLSGTTANWVTGGGVTTGNSTPAAPTSSFVINGNGNGITNGATTASLTNFTDFGSVFTRTFVIDNTGGGTLNIDSVKILGAGANRFSIVSFPGRTISTGTTAVVISFSPVSVSTSTASINILTNDCSNPLFTFVISGTGFTGAALAFAGSHTLTIPHSTGFNLTGALTLEAWVKTTYSGESYIITKNDDSWYLAINGAGGATGKASFYLNGVTPGGWIYGTTTISDDNWHHLAATYDGSRMRLYVDGDLEAQAAATGAVSTGINTVRIGSRTNASPFSFTGSMDEIRIWNTARNTCEIQRYMNCEIPFTAPPNLVANYHFNQGQAGTNNTGVTTLISSAGGNTGTLLNFALTGTASNWVAPGGVVSNYTVFATSGPTMTVRGNGNTISDGANTALASNFTDFGSLTTRTFVISNAAGYTLTTGTPYITGAQASDFSVTTVPAASINPGGTSSFVVTFNASAAGTRTATINFTTNDCAAPIFDFVVSATSVAGAALNFDGTSDYVKRTETNFGTNSFAIEMWVRPTSLLNEAYLVSNRTNEFIGEGYWFVFRIQAGGQLQYTMGEANLTSQGGISLSSTASLTIGSWQHVAVTRTGNLYALYINGLLAASGSDVGTRDLTSQSTYNTVFFGAWGPPLGQRYFKGDMDEVRLWNGPRTGCQIQQYMNCEIPLTAPSLIGNYHFNQGVAAGNNPGITSLTDVSGSAAHGVLNNFAMTTGTVSNFVAAGGVTSTTVSASVTASVSVTGNGTNIPYGSVSPLTSNFTDFGSSGTRTFVVSNNTGTLNVGKPFLTGANASEFTVTVLPASLLNPSTSTSLVVVFTPTSAGTKTATVNFGDNDCSKPWFSFRISATASDAAALDFLQANNNVISVPGITLNNQSFSIEFWAKRNNSNDDNYIVGQGTPAQNNALHIGFRNTNEFTFSFHTNDLNVTNAACTDGLYHHWACVYKSGVAGFNRLIYLDGNLIAADNSVNYTGTGTFYIGNHTLGTPDYFNGSIDELRVWNSVRSQCDIQSYMKCEIPGAATGLTANYHFNQGFAGAGNPTVTTLTDASGGNDGTLSNFSLNGATSNWTSPGGVTTNFTTAAVPVSQITVLGNGAGILNGATTPSVSNWTDFAAASSRTFVIDNTGTGTLNVGSAYITGANASDFSITVQPVANITTGTASLFVAFTPTAAGTRTAMINIPNNDCSKPVFSFVIQGSLTAAAALNFDGSDDQVVVGSAALIGNFGTVPFTMEAWVYPTSPTGQRSIIRKDGDYNLLLNAGFLQAEAFPGGSGGGLVNKAITTTPLTLNQWSHVAAVWSGGSGGAFTIYVNGLAVNTTTSSTTSATSSWLSIGKSINFGQPFQGAIDEVRLWKTGRTQCEIRAFMNCEIPGAAANLSLNYHFNQGFDGSANPTATLVTDFSGNNFTGTVTSFSLAGTTSNWVTPGGVATDYTISAVNPSTMTISGNGNAIPNGSTGTFTSNNTNFNGIATQTFIAANSGGSLYINAITLSGTNATDFSVTSSQSFSLGSSNANIITIAYTPTAAGTSTAIVNIASSNCTAPNYSFVITASVTAASALSFDGTDDYVLTPIVAALNMNNTATIEGWFKTSSTATLQEISCLYNVSNNGIEAQIKNGNFAFNAYLGNWVQFASGLTVNDGNWHHYAVVASGKTASGYVDGNYVGNITGTAPVNTGNAALYIGKHPLVGAYFNGSIDESRVWNTARTQCEIQSYMSCEIPAAAPGLVANYHFNQGIPSGSNLSVTTLTDAVSGITGTLNIFTLTGSTSNWISPGGVTSGYTAVATPSAEINVLGNNVTITNNDLTPSLSDNTDFNGACLNAGVTKTYTVQNTGITPLSVTSLTVTGVNANQFSLTASNGTIIAGGSSTFAITFSPTTSGIKNATVNIMSNDCDEALYAFAITGSVNPAPTISTSNGLICQGQSYTLTASGASTYTYSTGPVVSPVSTTNYSITGTSAAGCISSNTAVATVIVDAIPPVSIAGTNTICNGGFANFTASNANTYTWSTGATGTLVSLSPTVTTTYTVTGAYANGCSNTAVRTLSVYNTPNVSVNSGSVCQGQSFTITPSGADTYSFINGGPVVNPTVTTSYSVTGTTSLGCTSFPASIGTVSVISLPTVNISNYSMCSGGSVTLSATGAVSYTYQGGAAILNPTTTTSYTVAGANAAGCVNTATSIVTVNNSPTLTITASNTAICVGAAATLSVSGAMVYTWSNAATTNTTSVSPSANSTYTVSGLDANGCVGTASQVIVVNVLPTITVPNGTICPGNSFTLNPSGANTYNYSNGSNVVTPATTTSYSVSGTSTAGCVSSASAVATIYVINTVTVSITGNTTICNGQTATLTALGATNYSWTSGATTSTAALSPTVNTTYTVFASSGTCSNTAVVSVSVNASPTITVNSGTICTGNVFTMTPSGAVSYVYSSITATVNPTSNTTYSVIGTGTNGCVSTTSAISTVSVNALPTLTISTTNTAVCIGSSATLTASGAATYTWNNSLQTTTISVAPVANTGYTVTGTDANGCVGSQSNTVVVNALPTITVPNGTICPGNSFTLVPSGANTYNYSSGSNVVTPAGTTSYSVSGTSTAGCVSSASAVATVYIVNTLTVSVTGNTTICNGQTTTLTGIGAGTYSWTNGVTTDSVVLSPTTTTSYTVYGASGTCSNNAVVTVSVNASPTITVNSGTICTGNVFTMTPSGAVSYVYSSITATVNPTSNTTYSVIGTGTNGCVSTASAISTVSVNALPSLTIATTNTAVCTGSSATLTASGAATYTWNNSLQTTTISVSPVANTGYTVTGTDANGCIGSQSNTVVVNALPTITVPNGTICPGNSFTLVPSGANTYNYSSGSNVVTPAGTTSYSVSGTSTAGCVSSASAVATVYIVNTLTVSVTGNTTICNGQTTTLTGIGAGTYSWTNGVTTDSVVLSPTTTTSYTVYGASGTCSNNAVVTVSVNATPTITVNSGTICTGNIFTITASGAVSYVYSSVTATVNPVANTTYSVIGTGTNGCVSTTSAISTVSVNALPSLTIATTNTAVCIGSSATLTASGAATYTWNNSLQTTTISFAPVTNTGYTVTGTDANGCIGSQSNTIVVNALPTITVPNGTICPGNSFTLVPSGANTYNYSSGSNIVTPAGTTSYSVSGTSTAGCVSSASAVATVYVVNTLTVSITGNTTICNGQTTTLTASGATTYSWTTNALTSTVALSPTVNTTYTVYGVSGTCSNNAVVTVSVNATPTITVNSGTICAGNVFTMNPSGAVSYVYSSITATVNPTSNTTYSVIGTGTNGCVSTTSAISTVSVNALPTLTIATTNTAVCSGASATLTASGANTYVWYNAATGNTIAVSPASPATSATYSVAGTNTNGCVGNASATIVVNALPTITVPNGTICPGNSFTLVPSGANTYNYSSGINIVTPATTTTYSVSGTSTAGCVSSASAVATVYVVNSLTVSVTGNTTICNGQTTTLTASGATNYSWTTNALTATVALSPTTTTSYTVYGSSGTCSNNAVVTVSVNATPTITVNSGTICAGNVFTMTPGGAVSYVYSSITATVNPVANTTYSVIGTGANGCVSTTSAISTISVNALPQLTVSVPSASVCEGASLTLTASGANTYTWNNNSTLITNTLAGTPLVNTTYSVSGTDLNGCTGFTTQLIAVNPLPTITVNGGAVCPGGSFTLNPSGASTYSYSGGTAIVSPLANTDYSISGTSAQGCVSSTSAVATVSVVSTLTLTISGSTIICPGQTTTLTAGGASTYSWSTGVTTDTVVLSPTATTDYTVFGFSGSCIDKGTVTVTVNSLSTLSISGGTVCSGSNFTLNPTGALSYTFTGGSAIVNPTITTSYSVTGTDANGCVASNTAVAEVTVSALPTLTLAITNPSVCAGQSTSLSVSGAASYSWSTAETTATVVVTPTNTATYSVSGIDALGCSNTGTIQAVVLSSPTLEIATSSSVICEGTSATLTASGADTYTWSTVENTSSITVTSSVTATYTLTGSVNNCTNTATITVTVSAMPTLTLSGDSLACEGKAMTITAGGAHTYVWSNAQTSPSITVIPTANTAFTVVGTDTHSCSATAIFSITVKTCEDSVQPIKMVNAFTPNGDNTNDFWQIENIEHFTHNKVIVYNRWGIEMANIKGYDNNAKKWPADDSEGNKLSPSTYYYIIDLGDGSKPIKGWVEIIKSN